MKYQNIVITGSGSYIPTKILKNEDFASNTFYDLEGKAFEQSHDEISEKFHAITGIKERRYVTDDLLCSDIGAFAAEEAIVDSGIDRETIDHIIVAHNFGDIKAGTIQTDMLPSIASKIKNKLGITNPKCIGYDIVFGCPGWIQGVLQARSFMLTGMAKRCLVIGAETLSRTVDRNDRDSMIYSDGAGATLLDIVESDEELGILSYSMGTFTTKEAYYLYRGQGNVDGSSTEVSYLKMHGRKIYEFSLTHVPEAMKECLDKSGHSIEDVKKIFIHQANEKMDFEIVKRFYRLYKIRQAPDGVMPMSISKLGNSSVATIPTLYDRIKKGTCDEKHVLNKGDLILFASVGAGMNINAVAYRYQG
ncbi:MAG: ketoacyl-ACP synthase III [Bacteroidales bacterium]|nr:ketoacyl-ACP synthase III [Bacteroidales bacterium]